MLTEEQKQDIRDLICETGAGANRMKQIAEMSDEDAIALISKWKANKALEAQKQPLFNDGTTRIRFPKLPRL